MSYVLDLKRTSLLFLCNFLLVTAFLTFPLSALFKNNNYDSGNNYDRTYSFYVQINRFQFSHKLYVSIPPSLYEYYRSRSRLCSRVYLNFVTPIAVKPIADALWNATRNLFHSEEQFANAVLMIVHQLSYAESDLKYPVETLVEGSGDCDVLSVLAASIMKAGGLDVVLLYYKGLKPRHMNVGVHLPYTPLYNTWWMPPTYYEYKGKKYWVAECTPMGNWKVGDQPRDLANVNPVVIPVQRCEENLPFSVSARLDKPLESSSISITLSGDSSKDENTTLRVSGAICPGYPQQRVIIYFKRETGPWGILGTASTDSLGRYSLDVTFNETGIFRIKAGWSGTINHKGSDSDEVIIFIRYSVPLEPNIYDDHLWPKNPQLRAQRAMLYWILRSKKGSEQFFKWLGDNKDLNVVGVEFIMLGGKTTEGKLGFLLSCNSTPPYNITILADFEQNILQVAKQLNNISSKILVETYVNFERNTWYTLILTISSDYVIAKTNDETGHVLAGIGIKTDDKTAYKLGVYLTCKTNTAIAFKILNTKTFDKKSQVSSIYCIINDTEQIIIYIATAILLVTLIAILTHKILHAKENKPKM